MVEPAFTGYLAPEEHMADMLAELGKDAELHGRLAIAPGPARQIAWIANVWHDPRRIPIASIADGARALRAIQRNWALYAFGLHRRASVISDDKAPLEPSIAALRGIDFRRASAFSLDPAAIGPIDWLFSDVICYPARLLRLVETWLASGLARNFVCTLKFQGATDMETAGRFAAIPGSRLVHLCHNKHELTWIKLAQSGG